MKNFLGWRDMVLFLFVFGLGVSCAPPKNYEKFCGFVIDDHGQRVSWNGRLPIELFLHTSFPESEMGALKEALRVWETALGKKLFQLSSERVHGEETPLRDGRSVIYWLSQWEEDRATEQGRTDLYYRGAQLLEADLRINASKIHFDFYTVQPDRESQIHLQSLLVHELGHVLGLAHRESKNTVMKTRLAPSEIRMTPGREDLENLKCEY